MKQLVCGLGLLLCLGNVYANNMDKSTIHIIENKHYKRYNHADIKADYPYYIDVLYAVLRNYDSFKYFIPRVKKSEVIKTLGPNKALVQGNFDSPWPWPDLWTVVEVVQSPKDSSFVFKRIDGNIPFLRGKVSLKKVSQDTTRLHADVKFRLGHLIPKVFIRWGLNIFMPKLMYRINSRFRIEYLRNFKKNEGLSIEPNVVK